MFHSAGGWNLPTGGTIPSVVSILTHCPSPTRRAVGSGNPPAVHTQSTQWGVEKYGHCYSLSLFHFASGRWAVGSGRSMDVALLVLFSHLTRNNNFAFMKEYFDSLEFLFLCKKSPIQKKLQNFSNTP